MSKAYCVYGGHYGSEGKGSLAEWLAETRPSKRLAVFGENSPNSGHTCSLGKTRNIPASSYFADTVILGPDSVIDPQVLADDLSAIMVMKHSCPSVYIHENAAFLTPGHNASAQEAEVVKRISSTGSGSGWARVDKCFNRKPDTVVGHYAADLCELLDKYPIRIVNRSQYMSIIGNGQLHGVDCLFECSQGALLDVNFGIFPYVTSRTTLPRVAIERNGLGSLPWEYLGVYRTFPIRTGGPSGPTGGVEIDFKSIGQSDEIATVTKRTRRVFKFSTDDFMLSIQLTRPSTVAFTHLDYLGFSPSSLGAFRGWMGDHSISFDWLREQGVTTMLLSNSLGEFSRHNL